MITLGVETSCDETAVALVEDGRVLSSEVSSSVHLHSRYGGVVPEIASRFHTEYIFPVMEKALRKARLKIEKVDLVAVTRGPGLAGSLLVGLAFAKAIGFALKIPLVGVNHLHAHILSCFMGEDDPRIKDMTPFVGAVVSGGHTGMYVCRGINDFSVIGRTKDDAAGEAFDKVAKILDLGYPGGPVVEKRAASFTGAGDIEFPRALLKDGSDLDFSFSGIKTAVMYHWRTSEHTEREKDRICFSFQEAIVDVMEKKIFRAISSTGLKRLAAGGGVMNNETLRRRLERSCLEEGIDLMLPRKEYCTDNAAMIAAFGEELFRAGEEANLLLGAEAGGW